MRIAHLPIGLALALAAGCSSTSNPAGNGTDAGLQDATDAGRNGRDGSRDATDGGRDAADGGRGAADGGRDAADAGRGAADGAGDGADGGRGDLDGGRDAGDGGHDAGAADGGHDGGATCSPTDKTVFALSALDWAGGTNMQWAHVGFDIDGLVSTAASTNLCQPSSGGTAATAYPDGVGGIDNSFAKNVLPLILSVDPTWVTDISSALANGNFGMLLQVSCLPPTGDAPVLTTKLFDATSLGMMPKLDGTDVWPVAPELLTNPMDPESASIVFPASSVSGTTFSSGTNQTVVLVVPVTIQGQTTPMKLTLHAAQLQMTLSADRTRATGGILGGVFDTEELVTEVNKLAPLFGLCGSSVFTSLDTQVRQASDILADGTQDPTQTCNGISIGLTFEMTEAQLGGVGPAAPASMTCP